MLLWIALALHGCGHRVSTVGGLAPPVILPSFAVVSQGKYASFAVVPATGDMRWSASRGDVSPRGTYYAPSTMPPGRTIALEVSNGTETARAQVVLKPRRVEAADCFGLYGPRPPAFGEYVYVEELPEAVVRVPPAYPDSAREAGVDGTVMVLALVCTCGEVGDVRVITSIPMLDQAAIAAVRQWYFKPALSNREAVAVWVGIPIRFSLH